MSNFDPLSYAASIRAQNEAERCATTERQKIAFAEAKRLAGLIKARDHSVRSVVLFGSVAEGVPSNPHFDIDLALDGGDAYKAMDVTEESAFSVDVVELRLLPKHVQQRIAERGISL